MNRIISLCVALVCALALLSCGGGSSKDTTAQLSAGQDQVFTLTDAEIDAFVASPDLDVNALPAPVAGAQLASEPPVMPESASAQTASRGASTFGKFKCLKHWKKDCDKCKKHKCNKCSKYNCKKKDRCEPEHPKCETIGVCNFSERFWVTCDCTATAADVTYAAKVLFADPDCGKCSKAGVEVTFFRDGVEVGRASTNADGWAYFTEKNVPMGSYKITTTTGGQSFSADLNVVVYNACVHACFVGKGKLPSANGGKYMNFQYEGHFDKDQLAMPSSFSLSDGDINFVNEPITWYVVSGFEIHFGNGNVYIRAIDLGKLPGQDWISVDVWDRNYHNEGNLLNGQIRISYAYHDIVVDL